MVCNLRIEQSTWFKWLCVASVIIGIVLLTGAYDPASVSTGIFGVAAGLAAGLSYALFIFGFKNASAIGSPQTVLTVAFFAFCLILVWFIDICEALSVLTSGDIWWFLLLGDQLGIVQILGMVIILVMITVLSFKQAG